MSRRIASYAQCVKDGKISKASCCDGESDTMITAVPCREPRPYQMCSNIYTVRFGADHLIAIETDCYNECCRVYNSTFRLNTTVADRSWCLVCHPEYAIGAHVTGPVVVTTNDSPEKTHEWVEKEFALRKHSECYATECPKHPYTSECEPFECHDVVDAAKITIPTCRGDISYYSINLHNGFYSESITLNIDGVERDVQ